jgi:hypothetical protein
MVPFFLVLIEWELAEDEPDAEVVEPSAPSVVAVD